MKAVRGFPFSKIAPMKKKPLTVVALEIGNEHVKLVEMTRDENRVIAAGTYPLAPGRGRDPEHLAAQIRSAISGGTQGIPQALIASVPLGDAWLRLVDLPGDAVSEAEIRAHAEWELARYLGRSDEDVAGQFAVDVLDGPDRSVEAPAEDSAEGGLPAGRRVIAAAMPRDEVRTLRRILEDATGLKLEVLDIDAAALVNAFAANYPEFASARTVVIQANLDGIVLVRVHEGRFHGAVLRPHDADSVRAKDGDAQTRAETLLRLARGVADTLRASADGWASPGQLLLSGDLARDADFRDLLRAQLPQPFNLFNPFRNIPGPEPTEFPDAYPGAPLAAAVGLALRLAEDSR